MTATYATLAEAWGPAFQDAAPAAAPARKPAAAEKPAPPPPATRRRAVDDRKYAISVASSASSASSASFGGGGGDSGVLAALRSVYKRHGCRGVRRLLKAAGVHACHQQQQAWDPEKILFFVLCGLAVLVVADAVQSA